MPKEGETKPVFVLWNINKNNEFTGDFGFTPNIRISYDKSVHDLIPEAHKINNKMIIDYKKAMFGFISEKYAYKSRLSFEDAEIISDERKSAEVGIPAAGPKPSSYYDYLDGVDYNGNLLDKERKESGNIRGIKQYWLRDFIYRKDISQMSPDMIIKFKPLAEKTAFKGRIKFKNLNEDELGLLLWCLRLNDNCYHNIGMGKAYGYGRIKIDDIVVSLYDYTKLYNPDDISFNGIYSHSDKSVDEYICKYKDKISKGFLGSESVDDIESIKNFMLMKKTVFNKNEAENIRYMDIDKKEYQSRNEYLPYAEEVVKGMSGTGTANNNRKKSNDDNNKNRYAKGGSKNKKGKNSGNKNNMFNNEFKNNQLTNALYGIKFDD